MRRKDKQDGQIDKEEVEATLASLSPHPPWGTPPRTQADPVVSDKSHTPADGLLEVLLGLGLGGADSSLRRA